MPPANPPIIVAAAVTASHPAFPEEDLEERELQTLRGDVEQLRQQVRAEEDALAAVEEQCVEEEERLRQQQAERLSLPRGCSSSSVRTLGNRRRASCCSCS